MPHRGGGKIRIVVVASAQRMPQMPEVPTVIENGMKDFAGSFVGVLARQDAGRHRSNSGEGADQGGRRKSAQDKLNASGAEPVPLSFQNSKGFAEFIRQDYERSKEPPKTLGLKPE